MGAADDSDERSRLIVEEDPENLSGKENEIPKNELYRQIAAHYSVLGLTAFGGPNAHVAMGHQRLVDQTRWVRDTYFIELFALANALPGPSSTQLLSSLAASKAGLFGGFLALFLFQLPGFILLTLFGFVVRAGDADQKGSLTKITLAIFNRLSHGLVAAAFAQVALAAYQISNKVAGKDKTLWALLSVSTCIAAFCPPAQSAFVFPLMMIASGSLTLCLQISPPSKRSSASDSSDAAPKEDETRADEDALSRTTGIVLLSLFACVTVFVLIVSGFSLWFYASKGYVIFEMFWRMGGTVFGGGQVVLPMIYNEVVARGLLSESLFLSGFALVQCLPGPMFNLATFVGTAVFGAQGAVFATLGMFGPGILLMWGLLPFWASIRKNLRVQYFLVGINAAAGGLLNAALYVFIRKSIDSSSTFCIALIAGILNVIYNIPAPITIVLGGITGYIMSIFHIGGL